MSDRAWYRSLYWRIAVGFILLLGLLLVAQGAAFLWLLGQAPEGGPGRGQVEFAAVVAADLGEALTADPFLDVERYLRDRHGSAAWTVIVVMEDGLIATTGSEPPSPALVRLAEMSLREGLFFGSDMPLRRGAGRLAPLVPIVVEGHLEGVVMAQPLAPMGVAMRQWGPTVALLIGGLLVAGTALAALLIFRPAHRRLAALEDAVRRIGAGDLGARAPEAGGDEVAAVAGTFNAMAAELDRRLQELAAADRIRRQLLADVSHELMTPLTAMRGYIETLTMAQVDLDDERRRRYLDITRDETLRLERIVGDLLDLARLEAGGVTLRIESVRIADVFDRVAARHERACQERGVAFETAIAPDAAVVQADADRLEQALQNLAANALRYTPAGGRVRLETAHPAGRVVIRVVDSGPGIAPEHLAHIFDRFYKTDASRSGIETGSGLGLSVVKAIVERHGGAIGVRSTTGHGTTFEIELPGEGA